MGGGAKQGASTITQQFVKNALAAQNQRTVMQKLREAALAYHLENQWTKDKILTEYLNAIYFGNGAYGIEAAAADLLRHEAHPGCAPHCAQDLLPWEAALLAGVIASPGAYDPVVYPDAATNRRNLVLSNMRDQGYITEEIYQKGMLAGRSVVRRDPAAARKTPPRRTSRPGCVSSWSTATTPAAAFGGGLRIHTTLDLDMQQAAERAIERHDAVRRTVGVDGRDREQDRKDPRAGRRQRTTSSAPFNLATQGQRQPGSVVQAVHAGRRAAARATALGSHAGSPRRSRTRPSSMLIENYEDCYNGVDRACRRPPPLPTTRPTCALGWKVGTKKIARLARRWASARRSRRNTAMILGGLSMA